MFWKLEKRNISDQDWKICRSRSCFVDPCSRVDPDCFAPINVYLWKKTRLRVLFVVVDFFFIWGSQMFFKLLQNHFQWISSRIAPSSKGKNPAWEWGWFSMKCCTRYASVNKGTVAKLAPLTQTMYVLHIVNYTLG